MKKICFYIDEKKFVDFKLRLRHDGLTQTGFIEAITSAYLENTEGFSPVLHTIKERSSRIGVKRNTTTMRKYKEGQKNMKSYHLTDEEKNKIFDILDSELGEL